MGKTVRRDRDGEVDHIRENNRKFRRQRKTKREVDLSTDNETDKKGDNANLYLSAHFHR